MSPEQEFGVTVRRVPPPKTSVLAPERLLGSGRYVGERRRSKERRNDREPERPGRRRPPERTARRALRSGGRTRSAMIAGGVTVAAIAVGAVAVVALGGDDEAPRVESAPAAASVPAETVAAPGTATAATPVATTAATTVSASTAVTTSASTTTSVPATTLGTTTSIPVVPATPENVAAYGGWSGTYELVGTVTDGNPNFPAGTASEFELAFVGSCAPGTCSLRAPQFDDRPWIVQGDRLTAEYDTTEPCPDGSGTATTHVSAGFTVTSRDAAGRPVTATGEVTLETVDAATACADVTSDPVTYAYTMQRRG